MVEIGAILEGKVTGLTNFGAFVSLPDNKTGMVHISEVSSSYVNDIHDHLKEGQQVKVKVIDVTPEGKISLSIKKASDNPESDEQQREDDTGTPTRFFSPPGQEKHLTGRALTFRMDSNPLAGAFWFERMKADHMQDILEEARNVANGK